MQFSKWHALGNSYLVVEQPEAGPLTPNRVQRLCSVDDGIGSDGVLEVPARRARTPSSRSGTPTARRPRCRATACGSPPAGSPRRPARPRSRSRRRGGRRRGADAECSSTRRRDVGEFDVGAAESRRRIELTTVSVGNPHAVIRLDDPTRDDLLRSARCVETHSRFPGSHQRPARPGRRPPRLDRARLGAWRGGDDRLRLVGGRRGCGGGRARLVRQPGHGAPARWRPARRARGRPRIAHGPGGADRLGDDHLRANVPCSRPRSRTRAARR